MTTPTDPLFASQWHLPMLGNIRRIWDEFTGAGIRAVVYDDGVQFTHPDLAANYDSSMHFTFGGVTYSPAPLASADAHGTACAGLLGAVDMNGRGGVGVAHGVTLTGVNYLNDLQKSYDWENQISSPLYDAAIRWAARFDIMSNSWGTAPDFSAPLNMNIPGNGSAVDVAHFAWVSATGRGGLGTVIVKAAGNDTMNSNGEGTNTSRHTITVAAAESTGFIADYSNFGASILVTAPAAAWTTDLVGTQGYNTTGSVDGDPLTQLDYTSTFNGTSAATPVVSGVAALMLDANANLGWRDVQDILAISAGHTGSAVNASNAGAEVQAWQVMGGTQWNGGGHIFSQSYGYGMVDAFAAVRMAEVWTRLNGPAQTSANELHFAQAMTASSVAIRDSDGNNVTSEAQINFAIAQNVEIDTIYVHLTIQHSYGPDLAIYLKGPDGEYMTLFYQDGDEATMAAGLDWTFAAEAYRGMNSLGTWSIFIDDMGSGDTGVVLDASLEFFGSANSANDVHHFTDDFQMLRALESSRGVITDSNGGVDWLNFVAISKALNINMAAGGLVKFNGVTVASLTSVATVFERLQAGDGNDAITGNALANLICAGRGNDQIGLGLGNDHGYGEAGSDVLAGGAGNDMLVGGSSGDTLRGDAGNDTLQGDGGNDVLLGGADLDQFVFVRGHGRDVISDWADNIDTLRLDDAIWGGGLTVAQVVSRFGSVSAGSVVLTFNLSSAVTLQGFTNLASLTDDITII